ncbi:MAG: hypothetical protein A2X59_06485 [Nitrospirae bacterium GWC2_42_7]|nr:MAG: hypothetical protein A2X59_06485 [Nitrospirae bacterium GWC2_42_7]
MRHENDTLPSRDFYMDKLKNLEGLTPEKQKFMLKVIKLIATNSYLAKHMQGNMPGEIKELIKKAGNKVLKTEPA